MTYEFMQGYIHFINNDKKKEVLQPGYDRLFKLKTILELMMSGMQKCWTVGERITIDELSPLYNTYLQSISNMA
jgi:hypothetical protein